MALMADGIADNTVKKSSGFIELTAQHNGVHRKAE
jgi:hypothetical protein